MGSVGHKVISPKRLLLSHRDLLLLLLSSHAPVIRKIKSPEVSVLAVSALQSRNGTVHAHSLVFAQQRNMPDPIPQVLMEDPGANFEEHIVEWCTGKENDIIVPGKKDSP